ncbi:MAG: acyl-CoA desaturase [Actinobacteria bacterium ATB1]|nr:acyl-CoA desaturase [Actinobacteria bacterium ATB1]
MNHTLERAPDEKVNWATSIPFILIHVLAFGWIFTGVTVEAAILCFVNYYVRVFFITAGYHRYFSHKAFKASRPVAFLLAVGGASAAQKGPLWWAAHHRDHHRYSDTDKDIHSPLKGFWWSHVGWILCDKYNETKLENVKDLAKYPELRLVQRFDIVPAFALAIASLVIAGLPGLFFGFFFSTVLTWHGTFLVNSVTHVFGRRRYVTLDTSRNSLLITLVTSGEGWHNNHHYYPASCRQGFFWWELDPTYYVLKVLSWFGMVRDLKAPPARVLRAERIKEGHFDLGMFQAHWKKATAALHAAGRHAEHYAGAKRRAVEEFLESAKQTTETITRISQVNNGAGTATAGE